MIPNRKIPAVGKASYGRDFLIEKAVKTLIVSKLNRKFSAKTIIMKSYGRKVDAKVQYVPETKQVSKVVVVFPEIGEEANYLLVVFWWTKIVNLSETA